MVLPQYILIGILVIVIIYAYFKVAHTMDFRKNNSGFLYLGLIMFIALLSLFLIMTVVDRNEKLERQNKTKCPEYVPIHNVYILKKQQ